jgi:hypothetical protein
MPRAAARALRPDFGRGGDENAQDTLFAGQRHRGGVSDDDDVALSGGVADDGTDKLAEVLCAP